MRVLVLLRGAPGCGKSSFIRKMNWEAYTLCADTIRLMFEAPVMNHVSGLMCISQKHDKRVWELLFQLLEERMIHGEFCVIDATHSKSQDFTKYKKLIEQYRYRTYCIDFTDISLEKCIENNKNRLSVKSESYKYVPENIIQNIYSRFATQDVPKSFEVINHNDEDKIRKTFEEYIPTDMDGYKKVVVFGDIHGCWQPMKEYFDKNQFSDENLYIFIGDYLDRGIQNRQVMQWLLEHYADKNVILLQGNHEKWIINYANEEYENEIKNGVKDKCRSDEFFNNTIPQISEFNKKDLRQFCRKLRQMCYISFDSRKYIISHAGIGFMPESPVKISAETFIHSKNYAENIDDEFENNNKDETLYQIHGHRNENLTDIHPVEHSFNLCDKIENGGNLRILEILKDEHK